MRLFSLSIPLHTWLIACVVAFPRFPLFRAVVPRNTSPTADRIRLLLLSGIPPDTGDEKTLSLLSLSYFFTEPDAVGEIHNSRKQG